MRSRVLPQPGLTFEYVMWIFMRVSGLVLYILALVGIISAFVMGARTQMDMPTLLRWTFFPNPNHVVNSNIPDVTLGWANAYWQVMQMLFLFFAGTHALNGVRNVLEDYLGRSVWKPILRGLIFLLWMFMMLIAVYVVLAS